MSKRQFSEDGYSRDPWFRSLVNVFVSLRTEADIAAFLRDIGTLSELQAWSERFEVARQLAQGSTYREIAKKTGASTTTVTRVGKFLESAQGGYRKALKSQKHQHTEASPRGERSASVLQKYLEKAKNQG